MKPTKKKIFLQLLIFYVISLFLLSIPLMLSTGPQVVALIYLFPVGLMVGIGAQSEVMMFAGYFVYAIHFIFTLFLPSQNAVNISLFILLILLVINLQGCSEIMDGVSRIGS